MKATVKGAHDINPTHKRNSLPVQEALATYDRWQRVRIGDALRLVNGRAFKPSEWSQQGLPIVRIQNLNDPDAPFNYYNGAVPARFGVKKGDLLFAWSGTPGTSFGAHIWRGDDAWLNQHIFKVIFDETQFDKRFLRYAINQNLNQYIAAAHGGAGLAHITKGKFEASTIICPLLSEQRHIVAEIEKQFSCLEEVNTLLRSIESKFKRFRNSVLTAACTGALIGVDGTKWPRRVINELATLVQYGSSAKTQPSVIGIPVLRMGNIEKGRLVLDDLKYLPVDHPEFPALLLRPGDLLFNRTNSPDLVGKCAVYRGLPEQCSFASYLIRVRFCDDVDPLFVSYYINSPLGRAWVRDVVSQQVGQANVNGTKLKGLEIPVPTKTEQGAINAEVQRRLSVIEQMERQVRTNLVRIVSMRKAVVSHALSAGGN